MEIVGALDASTRLSELLDRTARGETFVITKQGHPVARLVPANGRDPEELDRVVKQLKTFRGAMKGVTREEIAAWKHEGRRS